MQGGGAGGGMGFSPRNMVDNWRAHPGQQAASTLLGMFVPGGGALANLGFRAYNNHQFDNAAQATNNRGLDLGAQADADIWGRPIDVSGGMFPGGGFTFGSGVPSLFDAIGGEPSAGAAQPWFENTTMSAADPLGLVPDYGGNGLAPVPHSPQARRDGLGVGNVFGSGPTNFMVGGSQVINGTTPTGDPNQAYYRGPGGMR